MTLPFRRQTDRLAQAVLAAAFVWLAAASARADDLHFASLRPEGDGAWLAEVAGKIKRADQLAFFVDDAAVTAAVEAAGAGRWRARLSEVPATARRISVGKVTRKGARPQATVVLAPAAGQFSDWTIYHIMLGHFANGDSANDGQVDGWRHPSYAGGDLQGVLDRVDYLAELGVNAVWLSPMLASRTSHGYDVTNYYRIGDAVGVAGDADASLALFRRLRQALQERGIRVILDLPLNHAGRGYDMTAGVPGDLRPRSTGARQEAEKVWDGWGAGFRYWNFADPPTRQFLRDAALYWLVEEQADGLRLDYVRGVPHDFWAELYAAVKARKPQAFLIGECWIDAAGAEANAAEIARYWQPVADVGPQFDSLLDFPTQITATDVFARGGSAKALEGWLQAIEPTYGEGAQPAGFLDNHDMTRFLSWTAERPRLSAAVAFLAALSSPMVMFYGTEAGLLNAAPKAGFVDSGRVPMPWDSLDRAFVAEIAAVLQARREHPALGRGGRVPLAVDDDTLVMAKISPEQTALVAVNLDSEAQAVDFDPGTLVDPEAAFERIVSDSVPARSEGVWRWRLPPLSTSIVVQSATQEKN